MVLETSKNVESEMEIHRDYFTRINPRLPLTTGIDTSRSGRSRKLRHILHFSFVNSEGKRRRNSMLIFARIRKILEQYELQDRHRRPNAYVDLRTGKGILDLSSLEELFKMAQRTGLDRWSLDMYSYYYGSWLSLS